jgi:prophage antirepressor-like protein
MNELISSLTNFEHTFSFENSKVRIIIVENDIYFCGKDIATILGYEDTNQSLRLHVREKHKIKLKDLIKILGPVDSTGPKITYNEGQMIYISEPGFYSLVLRSRAPFAEKFQDVVTEQILPSIRKTGEYKLNQELTLQASQIKLLENENEEKTNLLKEKEEEIEEMAEELESTKNKTLHLTDKILNYELFTKDSYIYLSTTKQYAAHHQFKFGKSNELNSRMSSYQVGRSKDDQMYYVFVYKCEDATILEYLIRNLLKKYRDDKNKDIYVLPFEILKPYIESICELYSEQIQETNQLSIDNLKYDFKKLYNAPPKFLLEEDYESDDEDIESEHEPEVEEEKSDSGFESDDEVGIIKNCCKCKVTKKISKFNRDYNRRDNHEPMCRDCKHLNYKKYRKNNPEKFEKIECPYCHKFIAPHYFKHGHKETAECKKSRK